MRQWLRERLGFCAVRRRGEEGGLRWDVGLGPHACGEYSIAVAQANSVLEDQSQVVASPSATFVGVYDGHGGPEASRFVRKHLVPHINQFAMEEGGLSAEVIRKAFAATEEGFVHLVKQAMGSRPQIASVGTCCLFGAVSRGTLYVANLGDSRAVLGRRGRDGGVVAERLSTDHNVAVEEVRKEVEALHPDDAHIVMCCRGVWRIKGIIQVSRSIGDVYLKKPEIRQAKYFPVFLKRPVISAEPSIVVRKLRPEDLFLIFASDGLWEQLSDEDAVNIVSRSPRAGVAKRLVDAALVEAARKKEMRRNELHDVPRGLRRQFHDDITVVVVYLDQHSSSRSTHNVVSSHSTAPPLDIFSALDHPSSSLDEYTS
uniref:protein-serine/threonine phosphatase n=2 Tax=Kalanchoe fedtschenkoi TaxID=63787 RepID=A0A7N0TX92_KALFE